MPKVEIDVNTLKVLLECVEVIADQYEADGDEAPPIILAALKAATKLAFPNKVER